MPPRISSAFLNVNKRLLVCVLCRNETGIPSLPLVREKRGGGRVSGRSLIFAFLTECDIYPYQSVRCLKFSCLYKIFFYLVESSSTTTIRLPSVTAFHSLCLHET